LTRNGKRKLFASFLTDGVSSRLTYEVVGPKVAKSEQDPRHLVKPHLQRLAETHPSVLPVWALDPGDTDVFSAFLWGTEKRVLAHWTLSGGYWRRKCGQIYAQKTAPKSDFDWKSTKTRCVGDLVDSYTTNLGETTNSDWRFGNNSRARRWTAYRKS